MRRRDIIKSLPLRELVEGIGYLPLLGVAAGAIGATVYYVAGDILRAMFWFLVMGHYERRGVAQFAAFLRYRGEGWVPFSGQEIENQEGAILEAWDAAKTLGYSIQDFTGRPLNGVESAEFRRLDRDYGYAQKKANREMRHRDLMVQANAKVAGGFELLSAARARVLDGYRDAMHADLLAQIMPEA